MEVALHRTYIALLQVASHTAGLWTRLKLGQEGKKVFATFYSGNPFPVSLALTLTLTLTCVLSPNH